MLLDVPASAAYLSVYEFLKKQFAGEKSKDTLTPGAILLAGGFAGIANWSVCIPADVLKSRLQTAPEVILSVILFIHHTFRANIQTESVTFLKK